MFDVSYGQKKTSPVPESDTKVAALSVSPNGEQFLLGHRLLAIDPRLWHAGQQIREFNLQNHEVIVVTEKDANDPQLTLVLSSPLVLNRPRSFMTDAFLGRVLLECLILGIITALVLIALKIYLKSASPPPGVGMLWEVLFLLASLFLLQLYTRGKWEDTIGFVRAWLNG